MRLGCDKACDTVPRDVVIEELLESNSGQISSLGAYWLFPSVCCVEKAFQLHAQSLSLP